MHAVVLGEAVLLTAWVMLKVKRPWLQFSGSNVYVVEGAALLTAAITYCSNAHGDNTYGCSALTVHTCTCCYL